MGRNEPGREHTWERPRVEHGQERRDLEVRWIRILVGFQARKARRGSLHAALFVALRVGVARVCELHHPVEEAHQEVASVAVVYLVAAAVRGLRLRLRLRLAFI